MHLKEVNDATGHRIVSGSEFQWACYPNARYIDYEFDSGTASALYNTKTLQVYEATVEQPNSVRPYRWLNPETKDAMFTEASSRGASDCCDDHAWFDLETESDFLEKLTAIANGLPFDNRIEVPLDLSDADFTRIAKLAHEQDITFNEMVGEILKFEMERLKADVGCGNGCSGCKCEQSD